MTIKQSIKYHKDKKKYCVVIRKLNDGSTKNSKGYILDYSPSFILMQEIYDFIVMGYLVIPVSSIDKIRNNNNDKYLNKIHDAEGITAHVGVEYKIDLTNWKTIFSSIKDQNLNVIVENENPDAETFTIGPIVKINSASVLIHYYNAQGFFDDEPSKINYNEITITQFGDLYSRTFSKYVRKKKG